MSKKGRSRLAAILQSRMGKVNQVHQTQIVEIGTVKNNGLVLEDFPDNIIGEDEYGLCSLPEQKKLKNGDQVLILWADDTPIIAGIIETQKGGENNG